MLYDKSITSRSKWSSCLLYQFISVYQFFSEESIDQPIIQSVFILPMISNNTRLRSGISLERIKQSTSGKLLSTRVPSTFDVEKPCKLWSSNKKVCAANVCLSKSEHCWEILPDLRQKNAKCMYAVYANAIAFAWWRCCERNFNASNCLPSQTYGAGRPHVGLCPKFPVVHFVWLLATSSRPTFCILTLLTMTFG